MAAPKSLRPKPPPLTKSQAMSRVRSKGTAPELRLRKHLWALGLRYRLHAKDLPGTPDIVFRGARGGIRARMFLARARLQTRRADAENQHGLLARQTAQEPRA